MAGGWPLRRMVRVFLKVLVAHRHACSDVSKTGDNLGAELRCGSHLFDIKDVRAMLGVLEVVQIVHVVFDYSYPIRLARLALESPIPRLTVDDEISFC